MLANADDVGVLTAILRQKEAEIASERALLRQAAMYVAKWSVEERENAPGVKAAGALLGSWRKPLSICGATRSS